MFFDLLFFVLGVVFGSFFSVVSYRYPKGISVAKGRSLCPHCSKVIKWYDNIPLFSFLVLGGKCRDCKNSISIRYPAIELISGLGFLYIWSVGGGLLNIFYGLVVFSILVLIFVIDLENQIIPDGFSFVAIGLLLAKLFIKDSPDIFSSLLAGFLAASFLLLINLLTLGRGMGLGDVKFAILGGLFVGIDNLLVWLFIAFLTGGFTGIILILFAKARLKDHIAFGPFLIIGLILSYVLGNKITSLILTN